MLPTLKQACMNSDIVSVGNICHSLAGESGNLGMSALAEASKKLEVAKTRDASMLEALYGEVVHTYKLTQDQLLMMTNHSLQVPAPYQG
jgi:HPt (histidine-containing phosphotransfer) domain-containing protein